MFDDDWGLEPKEVSPLGEELSLFDRPNEVERGRILEAHRLESILQQQIFQLMAPSHHDGFMPEDLMGLNLFGSEFGDGYAVWWRLSGRASKISVTVVVGGGGGY
ncbi:hypothetical protein Tco_0415853 [Tanacetum coccineum]